MDKNQEPQKTKNADEKIPYVGIRKQVIIVAVLILGSVLLIVYFVSTIHWGKKQTKRGNETQKIAGQLSGPAQAQKNKSIVAGLIQQPSTANKPQNPANSKTKHISLLSNMSGKVPGIPFKKAFDPNSANNSAMQVISAPIISSLKTQVSAVNPTNPNLSFQSKLLKRFQTPGQKKSENQKHIGFLKEQGKTASVASLLSPYGEYGIGTQYFIAPGAIISATLVTGVNSQLPGQVVAIANQDVYSHNLEYLLIPRGSELIGKYDTSIGPTQTRVLLAFSLVVFPDGRELQLPGFEGASHRGYAGVQDIVDYHFWSTAKSTSLLTLLDFGIQEAAGNTTGNVYPTPQQNFATSLSQNLGNVAQQIINEQISLAPTLKVEPGFTLNIIVTKNLIFKASYNR